ncbi:MAG: hypothetical protein K6U74_20380 [Firmicutes bacterium]|nr:hypothetical protein [Bacillota bacterium]
MKAGLYRCVAFLVLGILLGAGGTNMMIGVQVDYLTLANRNLRDRLADTERELHRLKESTLQEKKNVITAVEAELLLEPREDLTDYDQFRVKAEVNKKVKEWLNPLLGQDTAKLDGLLIPRIIDNREIEADGNKYRLKTHLVVVNRKTTVYVRATLLKGGGNE